MASPPPLHHHQVHHVHVHHHHSNHPLYPPLFPAIPLKPCCCCCCVRRILLHHHRHHHLFHGQPLPPWTSEGPRPVALPHPGVCPPPSVFYGDQRGVTAEDTAKAEESSVISEDISSNRLLKETWNKELENELGGEGEEEEDVYVLTDEWAEFFAKSEAKRQLDRRQKQQRQKGSI